jgi:DNA-binding transcriptional MerR regulator
MTFRAVRGRTYSLLSSVDLEHWEEVSFTVPSNDSSAKAQRVYKAEDVRLLEVRADLEESVGSMVYFKLMVQ